MGDIDSAPNGAQNGAMRPDVTDAIRTRVEAVRELISILVIAPQPDAAEYFSPTAESLRALTERLGRLLAQAGMTDCVRAATSLENAVTGIPDAESFRDMDAALTYLRARLHDVALQPAVASSSPSSQESGDPRPEAEAEAEADLDDHTNMASAADESAAAVDADTIVADTSEATPHATGNDVANDVNEVGQDDDAWDEDAFPTAAREAIRNFRSATLRQRAPGELTSSPRFPAHANGDGLPEHMRRTFLADSAAELADLRALLASFSKMPGNLDDLHAMSLLGHKVKGTAATYEFPHVADVMYCLETVPDILRAVATTQATACLNLLIGFADVMEAALAEAGTQGDASAAQVAEAEALVAEARALAAVSASTAQPVASAAPDGDALPTLAESISERATLHLPAIHRGDDDSQLRIEPRQFDSLMHQADGLAMNRAMLTQTGEDIRRAQSEIEHALARLASLSAQLTDLHPLVRRGANTEPSGASGPRWLVRRETSAGVWNDLELDSYTSFDDALRALSEAVLDASESSRSLQGQIQRLMRNSDAQRAVLHNMQQTIIHLRLVSLKTLADRVTLAAHQVAQSVGKQVEVIISGEDIEIDRNISETLIAPIVQLVRNAADHGIETPEERLARQKPAAGKIWLRASYSGSEVNIEVADDGRGINPHQLIAAAVAAEILDAKHADYLTREQALKLMFAPNLSTRAQADVIAGHGIGLDSVAADIERLRGTVSVRSEQGQGTVFQIRVPISLSITRALHVRAANNEYAIPFSAVRQMFTVPEAAILVSLSDAEGEPGAIGRFPRRVRVARPTRQRPLRPPDDPSAALYDEAPVFSLAELLGPDERPKANHLALLMDVGQRQVAILVDEVLDESEIVIRALPAHLRRRAVRGASIMPDGRLLLVLDLADLLTDALKGKSRPRPLPAPAQEPLRERIPQALVVDDSISMRRALQGPLANAGYDVRLARDGVEALGMMLAELPDVMILDIEMPRLDGFELLSVIRGNEALARVPVVILTSRAAEKHHRQAMELGARAYLTKPCPDDVLITTLQRVLREPQREP